MEWDLPLPKRDMIARNIAKFALNMDRPCRRLESLISYDELDLRFAHVKNSFTPRKDL